MEQRPAVAATNTRLLCYFSQLWRRRAVGWAERFSSNAWFGGASKNLIDTTVAELEAGNREGVLRSLKTLQQKYSPDL